MFRRRRTLNFNERLAALENRMEAFEDEIRYALRGRQVAEPMEELQRIRPRGRPGAQREREGGAHVHGEIEGLRAELRGFRTTIAPSSASTTGPAQRN